MWSAFMNGSGMHGGGGAGGGYVQSQGWEFVPCSGMDRAARGRGKSRSPSRRISSPPTVFSHIYDSQFGASPGGGDGGAGTQLEILRGQMWPGLEPLQQQQQPTQHTRLKKKVEDLKKRHVQDKEEWMREKESLLREVADIQGGENRRILLELKTVLEDVQVEVKREEEKRSELQLQYTRDRCAWELEKAELKCRIAQLEAREGAGFLSAGVQSASGSGSAAPRQHGEPATLRREREEQRRLLADTHSTAMELRCRLEHNERDWMREKAELLERFDLERREWEGQLKDMQRKIEVLYCDVRTKRQLKAGGEDGPSSRSSSTGSSLLSDNQPVSGRSSRSEPVGPLPGFVGRDGHRSGCFPADGLCGCDVGARSTEKDHLKAELVEGFRSRGKEAEVLPQKHASNGHEVKTHVHPEERPLWEPGYGSDKKKNTTALNAALKEIARVSEELCSYQDEIRKKSGDKRSRSESLSPSEGSELVFGLDKTRLQVDEAPCDLGQIYEDLRALERENWITLSPQNTWRADGGPSKSRTADFADPETLRDTMAGPGLPSGMDTDGPPIPPRSSSWNLSSPTFPDTELYIPESPVMTARTCHSPCALVDKKGSSPSVVRKFEAMLQENEGKVLIDGVVASCSGPANPGCVNRGCCHNRWSCDASRFTSSKLSVYGTVQKSFSEVNILTAAKGSRSDYWPAAGSLRSPELQIPPTVTELPLDLLLSSLEIPPAGPELQGSRRNITLEQKTAEFNRTLFQAEMGRGVEKPDSCSPTGAPDEILPPMEDRVQQLCTGVTTGVVGLRPEITLSQNPEVQSRRTRCGAEGQEVRMKHGVPAALSSSDQPQTGPRETVASQSPAHRCEVKHKGQAASGPSRKAPPRAEALFSEPVLPGHGVDPHGAKPQSARVGVSAQQPRHASVPPSQPDSCRPGPRVMHEHPWRALTLAAYPRPEGSRSNYGAVERILKNYESASRAQQNQNQPNKMDCSPVAGAGQADIDPPALRPSLRRAALSSQAAVQEGHPAVEENHETLASSVQKNFSRPARPAHRRLPSRWAGRLPTSSSTSSSLSSMSFTPVPPSFTLHKHSSSFSYSHAFHMETVIV